MPTRIPKTNRTLAQALALNYRVAPAIDEYLEDNPEYEWTADFKPKIPDDAWHPSGDCTPTVYELWMKASEQNVRKPNTLSQKKTFQLGHYFHQWIQDILIRIEFADPHQRLLATVRLRDQEVVDVDAQLLGVFGVERVLGVDECRQAACFLCLRDHVEERPRINGRG